MRTIVALLPELTDVNGDAQNASVLARRARWAGEDVGVQHVHAGETPIGDPLAVVIGTTTDPALARLLEALSPVRERLAAWFAAGVPILAVGTGLEALGTSIALPGGGLAGLGLIEADSAPLPARVAGDLVVQSTEGQLVGYENHTRGLRLGAGLQPLGRVLRGVGDGAGTDGVRTGSLIGTRLHGPVLAKNPALADAVLAIAFGRPVVPSGPEATAADAGAARIRAALLAS
jgi:CobQ-like glutamine amidotransferase family enzyme